MQFPALNRVECAILHDDFKPMDGQALFAEIERLAIELNYAAEVQLMVMSTEKDIYVHAGGHRILVSQNEQPLALEGFTNALSTPYTSFTFKDNPRDIVERHKANTFVTIAKGVLDNSLVPDSLRDSLGKDYMDAMDLASSFTTLEEADRARKFCYELTKRLISNNPASAIHWCVSDNLVPQSYFEGVTQDGDLLLLNIRPFLSSSAGRIDEGLPLGMFVHGSQWVIGKMIEFEEAPVPFPWMMEVVCGFIKVCQIRGSIIPHNNTFSTEGADWTVAVYHEKIEGHTAWETVRLEVINAPQFGIQGDTSSKRQIRYENDDEIRARAEEEQNEVNENNTAQLLEEKTSLDAPISRAPEAKALETYAANDRRKKPRLKQEKQDIHALRELMNKSNSPDDSKTAGNSEKKGLFARTLGVFSKKNSPET